jgi:hypothetical protein
MIIQPEGSDLSASGSTRVRAPPAWARRYPDDAIGYRRRLAPEAAQQPAAWVGRPNLRSVTPVNGRLAASFGEESLMRVLLDAGEFHYLEYGDPAAPPMVLLHGLRADSST